MRGSSIRPTASLPVVGMGTGLHLMYRPTKRPDGPQEETDHSRRQVAGC